MSPQENTAGWENIHFVKIGGAYRTHVFAGVSRDLLKCFLCPLLEVNQTLPVPQMKRNYTLYEFQCVYSRVSKGPFRMKSSKHRNDQSVCAGVARKQVWFHLYIANFSVEKFSTFQPLFSLRNVRGLFNSTQSNCKTCSPQSLFFSLFTSSVAVHTCKVWVKNGVK